MEQIDQNINFDYLKENLQKKYEEELQIVKNEHIYTFKIILEKKNLPKKIKITVSFIKNNKFQIYEGFLESNQNEEEIDNPEERYDKLYSLIKEEKIEIIHQNNNDRFILLKLNDNNKITDIKLFPLLTDEKSKSNEFKKNYITLEKNYIQLKKEINNQNQIIKSPMNITEEDEEVTDKIKSDNDDNNSEEDNHINFTNPDEKHILLDTGSKIWCMLKLNKIVYEENSTNIELNLVAIGFSNYRIILINLDTLKIYQELKTSDTAYSLSQFKDDPKYLICSLEDGKIVIYILKNNKYEQFQILEKPEGLQRGEINKVITLSDGNLATAERDAISIWKPKINEEGLKQFEFFKELMTFNDTCQLLEVNPEIFVCAIYNSRKINFYKNDGNEYPLLGYIDKVESHGINSNAMARINDNIFCSGGKHGYFYIVSVNPIQLIQKFILTDDNLYEVDEVDCIHNSNDGFIFTSCNKKIFQYKIIEDEDNNFIRLEK